MLTNGYSPHNEKAHFSSDSWTSNSETSADLDLNESASQINKQWNAIERTLYEEEGEQVSDPEILKECNLWKESFPHLRVRGTKIDLGEGNERESVIKRDFYAQSQIDPNKINEKRETIKNRVVGEIVQRLITRFNQDKLPEVGSMSGVENSRVKSGSQIDHCKRDAHLKSVIFKHSGGKSTQNIPLPGEKISLLNKKKENREILDRESYFERGKVDGSNVDGDGSIEKIEKRIYEIFEAWEGGESPKNPKETMKPEANKRGSKPRVRFKEDFEMKVPRGEKIGLTDSIRLPRGHGHKSWHPGDLLSRQVKPFEPTKRIDKKYEGLLNKIVEKNRDLDSVKHCRNVRSPFKHRDEFETPTYLDSLEEIRRGSGFDEFYRRNRQNLPKILTLRTKNNWLERGEIHKSITAENTADHFKTTTRSSKIVYSQSSVKLDRRYAGTYLHDKFDETFFEREIQSHERSYWKRPSERKVLFSDTGMSRPKPVKSFSGSVQRTRNLKSSSCGDLSDKTKTTKKNKIGQDNLKKEGILKRRTKFTSVSNSKTNRRTGNDCEALPLIDTGIICTELRGLPKIGTKAVPRKC